MYTMVASLNKTIVWIKSPPFERQRQQNWLRVKAEWHIQGVPSQPGLLSKVAIVAELPVTENAEKSLGPLSELHPASGTLTTVFFLASASYPTLSFSCLTAISPTSAPDCF